MAGRRNLIKTPLQGATGRGVGRAIAAALADAGADVVVTARRAPGDTPERLAAAAVGELGRLDIWVNNAGGPTTPRSARCRTPPTTSSATCSSSTSSRCWPVCARQRNGCHAVARS